MATGMIRAAKAPGVVAASQAVGVALAYAATAYFSLFLAIPPGYASPIWPAAAVALAAVLRFGYHCLPGVFCGSLAINLYITVSNGHPLTLGVPWLLGAGIGLGATAQAATSVAAIRTTVNLPTRLEQPLDIAMVSLLGGPVGCLVSSLVGSTTLLASGVVSDAAFLDTWFTWWVGDTLGVLCFGPLLIALSFSWEATQRTRMWGTTLVHVAGFSLVVYAVTLLKSVDQAHRRAQFKTAATEVERHLVDRLHSYRNVLDAVDSLFSSTPNIRRENFELFTRTYFAQYPAIHGLSWNAKVTDRPTFEAAMRRSGFPDFFIWDQSAADRTAATQRPVYFPVTFAAPEQANAKALGFDVYANPARKPAMDKALARGIPQATGRIRIVQKDDELATLVYHAVHRATNPNAKGEAQAREHLGYAVGIFLISELLEPTALYAESLGLHLTLRDGELQQRPLFDNRTDALDSVVAKYGMTQPFDLNVFGAAWTLSVSEGRAAVESNNSSMIWVSLIGGCLFSGLLGVLLLLMTGRTEIVRRLVADRTKELNEQAQLLSSKNGELKRLARKAEAASVAKSRFLATMSHEIRTPMNGLLGVLHLLSQGLPEEKLALLATAHESGQGLLVLLNDILDFSKIEAGQMALEEGQVDVLTLVEEVAALFHASAQAKGVSLRCIVPPQAARTIPGDLYRLKQILSNLVGNAVKFTGNGSVEIRADYCDTVDSWGLRLSVCDSGIGIAPEALHSLFDSFTQADSATTRQYGGSGLGLSICKRLAALMHGDILVESQVGHGSTFTLHLPFPSSCPVSAAYESRLVEGLEIGLQLPSALQAQHLQQWLEHWRAAGVTLAGDNLVDPPLKRFDVVIQDALWAQGTGSLSASLKEGGRLFLLVTEGQKVTSSAAATHVTSPPTVSRILAALGAPLPPASTQPRSKQLFDKSRILLVDDNAINLRIGAALLKQRHGTSPALATTGREALVQLSESKFDLVLMDCMMPDVDGYQATASLRAGDAGDLNRETPVIALTANALPTDRQLCLDAGMSDYLTKPVQPEQLEEILCKWLGHGAPNSAETARQRVN